MKRQRGAALLVAMLILTLVATAASAMVWHQHRAVEAEAAERVRAQGQLMLAGALDFVRLQLGGQSRNSFPPRGWVGQLPESSIAALLAADRDNNADSGIEAFLSGEIVDAQSRYNLRRLLTDDGKVFDPEVTALRRLCEAIGLPASTADRIAAGLADAWYGRSEQSPLPPTRLEQLAWLGLDTATLQALAPYVTVLPTRTTINANTAAAPALLAAIDGLSLADAQRLAQQFARNPAATLDELRNALGETGLDENRVGVTTRFFDVTGRLRSGERVLEERWLLERRSAERGNEMALLQRDRRAARESGG